MPKITKENQEIQINYFKNKIHYVLIDMSYMIFYRYYALIRWWKFAKPNTILTDNPADTPEFINKFIEIFSKIKDTIIKKLDLHKFNKNYKFICVKDCPRLNIWRNDIFKNYKINRNIDDSFMGGDFFKLIYNNGFLNSIGFDIVLEHDKMEGDDIIAIIKNIIRKKYPINEYNETNAIIYIIANDNDYLQLYDTHTNIINLSFKSLNDNTKIYKEANKNLLYKILTGDKSDCIPPIFNRLNKNKFEEYYNNENKLLEDLQKLNLYQNYILNKTIIDFNYIPIELINSFNQKYKTLILNI